jgi:hypothetical protein
VKYALLIYQDERERAAQPDEEIRQGYRAFTAEASRQGKLVGVAHLHSTTTATAVRVREGKLLTTDGPFAETREQLAGFFLLDCTDLDGALAWARKIPSVTFGTVEIRPVVEYPSAQARSRTTCSSASLGRTAPADRRPGAPGGGPRPG